MLYALWLGVRGRRLDAAGLAAAEAAIAPLSVGAVAPLRRLRRQLRDSGDRDLATLRRRLLALELAAERRVQSRLAALAFGERSPRLDGDRLAAALANLKLCLGDDSDSPQAEVLARALAGLLRSPAGDGNE